MLFPDPDEEEKEKKSEVKESENLEALLSEERHKPESEGVRSEQLNELGEMKPGEPQDDALSELEELEKLDAGETHKGSNRIESIHERDLLDAAYSRILPIC
uniref:CTNNB1_binding domain-containing protein n=1 Tax=Ascaris lumbricoides TaxID=6252 RepID=A0A0M3IX74_ASCLU